MKRNGKKVIAIFSGDIPSSSFIEHLITGLSKRGYHVQIFGKRKKKVSYGANIEACYFASSIGSAFWGAVLGLVRFFLFQPHNISKLRLLPREKGVVAKLFQWQQYLLILNKRPDILHIQWIKQGHEWLFLRIWN